MTGTRVKAAFLGLPLLVATGCVAGNSPSTPVSTNPASTCVPSTTPEYAYSVTGSGYSVAMFTVDSCSGALTSTTPGTVATGYAMPQGGSEEMTVDPLGRFAYVANLVSNASDQATISMYTINPSTGVLTATTPATVATGFFPQGITIDPQGRFVYTANSDGNSVSMFTINQTTGVLTPTNPPSVSTQAQVSTGIDSSPDAVAVDPSGQFLYSVNEDNGTVSMFTINQTTGVLTPTSPATVFTGPGPFGIAISPNGKFAYVPNSDSGGSMTYGVSQYTINPTTGVLTQNNPPAVAAGNFPTAAVVDPTSRYLYVVNRNDNNVSIFTIDQTTGNLTANGAISAESMPFRVSFDPSGKFLYVVDEDGPSTVFTVKSDGTLAPASASPTGTNSLSIGFAVPQ